MNDETTGSVSVPGTPPQPDVRADADSLEDRARRELADAEARLEQAKADVRRLRKVVKAFDD
jgi:hypothetical protein